MRLTILAVGGRVPGWVAAGYAEYARRLPPEIGLALREIRQAGRTGGRDPRRNQAREALAIRKALPARGQLVALHAGGRSWTTEQLAGQMRGWQMSGDDISLLIGGPDGIDAGLLRQADVAWSLSPLTLPRALVRVVLAEQLYRAWSINAGHPYHRG